MGYFSNGSEGSSYESKYCENCIHWVFDEKEETKGCPVWDIHFLFNHSSKEETKNILNELIPTNNKRPFNEQCAMFIQIKSEGQSNF